MLKVSSFLSDTPMQSLLLLVDRSINDALISDAIPQSVILLDDWVVDPAMVDSLLQNAPNHVGPRSGLFGGQYCGLMKSGVSAKSSQLSRGHCKP